jgi:hypothetical protein
MKLAVCDASRVGLVDVCAPVETAIASPCWSWPALISWKVTVPHGIDDGENL